MTSCVHWVGGTSFKKLFLVLNNEVADNLDLAKPLKILMKEFNLVRLLAACNFTKNKLLHKYKARISKAYSQQFAAFFQFT